MKSDRPRTNVRRLASSKLSRDIVEAAAIVVIVDVAAALLREPTELQSPLLVPFLVSVGLLIGMIRHFLARAFGD